MIEAEIMPRMIKTSEDAILLGITGGVQMNPMTEGEVEIETDMTEVDIKVTELIGICITGRHLAQELKVRRRAVTAPGSWTIS